MISREEHDRIIRVFLVELNHVLLNLSDADLQANPSFAKAAPDYISNLRDPGQDLSQTLYCAYGLVDEFVHFNADVLAASYAAISHKP